MVLNEKRHFKYVLLSFSPAVQFFGIYQEFKTITIYGGGDGSNNAKRLHSHWPCTQCGVGGLFSLRIMNIQIEQKYLMMVLGFKVKIN